MNLLCCFILVVVSARALVAYLIDIIRIKKFITLCYSQEVEVECMPRDIIYGVELSALWLNLIAGFTGYLMQS